MNTSKCRRERKGLMSDYVRSRSRSRSSHSSRSSSSSSSSSISSSSSFSSSTSSASSASISSSTSSDSIHSAITHYDSRKNARSSRGRSSGSRYRLRPTNDSDDSASELTFHRVHGKKLKISGDGCVARRTHLDFYDGHAYSAKPIRVNEKVYFRVVRMSDSWTASVDFGFTTHDPALTHSAPSRSTTNWVLTLKKRFLADAIMYYYVDSVGDVYLGVNNKDKAMICSNMNLRSPFRAIMNIHGKNTTIQLMNKKRSLRHLSRAENDLIYDLCRYSQTAKTLPHIRYNKPVIPLELHNTKGQNIEFSSGVVARMRKKISRGYVFSSQPIIPSQTVVIQILSVLRSLAGHKNGDFAYGITSCDPAALRQDDLPYDADRLLRRPEYWYVHKLDATQLKSVHELTVTLGVNGDIKECQQDSKPVVVDHVDDTSNLWIFVALCGAVQKVRMMITSKPRHRAQKSTKPSTSRGQSPETNQPTMSQEPSDDTACKICYDRLIDCVISKCGHMCACYICALQLWKDGGGLCPICRVGIQDVIKIYKS